jgi:hypothetical protein
MNRRQLEHVIRAACEIADDDELIVIGSQAVLGQFPDAPEELLVSMEVDVYPKHRPERAELIDGSIGELSMFHETFGYYADGVSEATATLPAGWRERLVAVTGPGTSWRIGWTLEIHDLMLSNYVAGREKDRRFNRVALRHRLAHAATLADRLGLLPVDEATRKRIAAAIAADSPDRV